MKRFTMIMALVAMMVVPVFAERVTPETARKVATTFLNNNGAKSAQLTDLSKKAGFPNLYIFSTESSFVVMAADDCVKPILGYSLSDRFDVDDMPENMKWWIQQYSDEIQWGIENNIQPDKSTTTEWQDLKEGKASKDGPTAVVGPLLSTKWDQGSPYNMYCPSGTVTGCVATAMAQVMKYWNYPEQGQGSHSYTPESHPEYGEQTVDFEHTIYDWANMTNTYSSLSTLTQQQAVATLMYHCGVSVDMKYRLDYEGGSSALSSNVPVALVEYFRYAPSATYKSKVAYTDEQWIALLQSELDENRPVYYSGQSQGGGHAFVCDGYRSDSFFHFNWGWGGSMDNYFAIGALNPGGGGTGSGSGSYNLSNGAAIWVEPISSLAAPTLSATAINGTISLEWDAIEGADSYNLYRDNVKIVSNITENNYMDSDIVSGFYYEYHVRAVSNGTMSNPSNRVTKMPFFRNYTPADLCVTKMGDNAALTWIEPTNNSAILQYATGYNQNRYGMGPIGKDTYWAEVFAPSRLTGFEGMYIEKVSVYCYLDGVYTLLIYEDGCEQETNKLCEQTISVPTRGWSDIVLTSPVPLDCTKELWIIMHYPYMPGSNETYLYPAASGNYNEIPYTENEEDEYYEERCNPRLIGGSLTDPWYYLENNSSWLFKTYISDGTYTYNIYDGTTKLNSETVTGSSYTHESPTNDTIHQYTVTTNYYGGESTASNIAGLALGTVSMDTLELGENDKMTLTENSTLTVTGTLSNDNAGNLVLENGAQLIHSSVGVKAMVKKSIAPINGNQGWNFIASPVTENFAPSIDNGFLNGEIGENNNTYDLYYYDEPEHYWRNYETHSQDFTIEHEKGYLYADSAATTLQFVGTLNPSHNAVSISNLSHSATELTGFNLVGNPFACNATVNTDYYVIDASNNSVVLAEIGRLISPCEGIIVKASETNNYQVTFSKPTRGNVVSNHVDIVISQGRSTLDRARVRLGEGTNMEKFSLSDNDSRLYIPQNGQDFAVAYASEQKEMPVNFKAMQNGIYTLTLENESLELDYLHLIDNMTGSNIDLLTTPSYTFEATMRDYESRFRLIFANCEDTDNDNDAPFAYINNGEIVVTADAGAASLQVIDATGRVVRCTDGACTVSTNGMAAGVYVLRLITAKGVKTQKMVIE